MHQTSALYDPIRSATPEQRLQAIQHKKRIDRIAARAIPIVPQIIEIKEPEPEKVTIEVTTCNGQVVIVTDRQVAEARAVFERIGFAKTSIETIQRAVCKKFGITRVDLNSQRRTKDLVIPRQVAMYLSKTLTLKSLPEIGRRFGGRDHTTVLHSVRKMAYLVERDEIIRQTIDSIKSDLGLQDEERV